MAIDDIVTATQMLNLIRKKLGREAIQEDAKRVVIDKVRLSPKDVDAIYLAAKKMQRDPNDGLTKYYYARFFRPVEAAYLSQDMTGFIKAVRNLAIAIYAD